MAAVSTTGGLTYGFRVAAAFAVCLAVGVALVTAGTGMVATARSVTYLGAETDWLRLVGGALLSLVGGLVLSAGSAGLLYKVVADGVRRGNSRAV